MNLPDTGSDILISTDSHKLDLELVYHFLKDSYWAKGRSRNDVEKTIEHSCCFGIYYKNDQIGFARVVTDYVTFSYLMDVFIIKNYRGLGYGKKLVEYVLNYRDLSNIEKWLLSTSDAHGLYKQFGFTRLQSPEKLMELIPGKI